MEAFHLLSRGGVKFDKRRFQGDVELFNVSKPITMLVLALVDSVIGQESEGTQGLDVIGSAGRRATSRAELLQVRRGRRSQAEGYHKRSGVRP